MTRLETCIGQHRVLKQACHGRPAQHRSSIPPSSDQALAQAQTHQSRTRCSGHGLLPIRVKLLCYIGCAGAQGEVTHVPNQKEKNDIPHTYDYLASVAKPPYTPQKKHRKTNYKRGYQLLLFQNSKTTITLLRTIPTFKWNRGEVLDGPFRDIWI